MSTTARLAVCALLCSTACSGSPPAADGGTDDGGSRRDGGTVRDGSLRIDGSLRTDGGTGDCAAGMHMCPGGCEPDRANDPERGCRLGCGSDTCPVPTGGEAMCDMAGMCLSECPPGSIREGDVCCGGDLMCSDGIEMLLACPSPSEEPNETNITPRRLGTYNDEDARSESMTGLALPTDDTDFYAFDVVDTCCSPISASTIVRVTVTTPVSGGLEVAAWFSCMTSDVGSTCMGGTPDAMFGVGCSSVVTGATGTATATLTFDLDCSGIDENGTALVRVRPATGATECAEYTLSFDVTT